MKNYTFFVLCVIVALICATPLISHAVELTNDDFEAGFGDWSNVTGDQADWIRRQGSTPTTDTGPNHDNTIGDASGYYLHMEASNPLYENDAIYLESPNFDADAYDISLEFYYHMYGADMGTLNVDVYNGSWNLGVWSISGQQHTSSSAIYTKQVVDLSSYTGTIKIRFRGVDGSTSKGDMAIDDVVVYGLGGGTQPLIGMEDLEVLASYWLQTGCGTCGGADYSGDSDVDLEDFAILADQWLNEPPAPPNPLVINEFMASNDTTYADPCGDYDDWIEIHNSGIEAIDIGGMYMTDELAVPTKWQIPTDNPSATTIAGNGYLLIWADEEPSEGTLHTDEDTFKLSAGGEDIALFESDGTTLVDSITFGEQVTDISYGRYPDASSFLRYLTPTPLSANISAYLGLVDDTNFSHGRGFYTSSFYLGISCDTTGAEIRYTTNGSEPTESSDLYSSPLSINSTTCVRAKAFKAGWKPSNVDTQTYIFVADVITQDSTPAGWPTGPINGQEIDYGMDPDIVDGDYEDLVDDALLAIPTISLVTDLDNLFDPSTGIYVNAEEHGELWERPTSVELINPDGSEGFQVDAGLRIRGGWSRRDDNPKHAFRLFFRTDYGDSELDYPMFENEGVDKFEKLDLRTAQNYSWSFYGDSQNTMLREVFSRDTQGQMDQPYTRSRYYHLYINGHYWGLYQSEERPEARYAASYFGGTAEDYDVVKPIGYPEPGAYTIEATDGTLNAYEDLWDAATAGFASDSAYYQVQGLNTNGTRNPAYPVHVDVDNLADYMINTFYVGDLDSPVNMWHNGINNFYGIRNRNGQEGWKFFRRDAEHSLFAHVPGFDATYVGYNASIDVTGPWGFFSDFPRFNPRWLHEKLAVNANYRLRFADRVYKHFFNDGPFKASTAVATITARKNQIDSAIIAESARWGDAKTSPAKTRNDDWLPTVNTLISDFFPTRVSVVIGQLRADNWYPDTDPPTYNQHGGYVSAGFNLTMSNPNGSGTIYYTLNGSDPQTSGITYSGTVTLNKSTQVKARVLDGSEWSAVNETIFAIGPVAENLRITEIMYHPEDTGSPDDPNTEYIELKNTGATALNLNLVALTNGVYFTFPDMSLSAGDYVLVVKSISAFEAKYGGGKNVAGEYTGSLSNGGEEIDLDDAIGTEILDFDYKDGWRDITDGDGFSLTIINPSNSDVNSWDVKASWRASAYKGGSPDVGDEGIIPNPGDIAINEVLAHSDTIPYDWIELHNTTGSSIDIGGWYLSDNDSNETTLKKSQIAPGTFISGNGYIVFYQNTHFSEFALSENGETLCLSSADGGVLTGFRKKEDFGASQADTAFGRYQKSDGSFNFVAMSSNTAGSANAYPKVGPIVINEIMYNPQSGNQDEEYIELHNISGSAVTLYDSTTSEPWKFTDGIDYTFSGSTPVTIPAGGYLMVVKNPTAFTSKYGSMPNVGPYDGYLSNGGEKVEISMPGDVDGLGLRQYIRIDRVNYSDGSHPIGLDPWPTEPDANGNYSLTRKVSSDYGNDVDNWQASTPTPGL